MCFVCMWEIHVFVCMCALNIYTYMPTYISLARNFDALLHLGGSVHMCVLTCVHTYAYTLNVKSRMKWISTCMRAYIRTGSISTRGCSGSPAAHAYTHTRIHASGPTTVHTCMHTYKHTHTHTYINTYTHTGSIPTCGCGGPTACSCWRECFRTRDNRGNTIMSIIPYAHTNADSRMQTKIRAISIV